VRGIEPRMLLVDEPFGALDAKVRRELRSWLRSLHDQLGLTTIFVTHDQDEAFALAGLVAIINKGRVEQFDVPERIRRAPGSQDVDPLLAVDGPCQQWTLNRHGRSRMPTLTGALSFTSTIAANPTMAAHVQYQAGARGLPVMSRSQRMVTCVDPPKIAIAKA